MIKYAPYSLRLLLVLTVFSFGCSVREVSRVQTQQYVMSDSLFAVIDSGIYKMADVYRKQLTKQMQEVLCTSAVVMEKGNPESVLGNFVTDVCLQEGNLTVANWNSPSDSVKRADFIILNSGGLRKPLPKGRITLGDLYEVMPFENQLVLLTCSGTLVQQIADFIASKGGTPVSGIRFQIDKSTGKAVAITINGIPLNNNDEYTVMTADYLANGGDNFELFKSASRRIEIGLKVRDALINYSRKAGNREEIIKPKMDGRLTYVVE
jgi:2',3'-cyclic-nucleotide 2'-phosphodiesterase (5'-nucleotidase family)